MGKGRAEKPLAKYQQHAVLFKLGFYAFLVTGGLGLVIQIAFMTGRGEKMMDALAQTLGNISFVIGFAIILLLFRFPRFLLFKEILYAGPGQSAELDRIGAIRSTPLGVEIEVKGASPIRVGGSGALEFATAVAKQAGQTIVEF